MSKRFQMQVQNIGRKAEPRPSPNLTWVGGLAASRPGGEEAELGSLGRGPLAQTHSP